ncbi:MAG: PAS domain-containing methyl-accepting chemotaxis protein [Stappiaceae bacterium]
MLLKSRKNRQEIALDFVSSNIMIADNNGVIRYINDSLRTFFEEKQEDIRKNFPDFAISNLIGTNFDIFHKNPDHQRKMIAALSDTHAATITIGNATFDLIATPLASGTSKRQGTLVEWRDAELRLQNIDFRSQIQAIERSQASIRFDSQGVIIEANENFLQSTGYSLSEITGQHHRIFVEPEYAESDDYLAFWKKLGAGEFHSGEYQRYTKEGSTLWLRATYNPLQNDKGEVIGVIKFATNITQEKQQRESRERAQEEIADGLSKVAMTVSDASLQADDASSSSQTTASTVQSISAAIEELVASVQEINRQVLDASEISTGAVEQAEKTNTIVSTMSDAATEIENVVNLISDIAEQTNLLALNATIEAARAGESGKGFAVVAAEVKGLATQTSKATDEITSRITNVQRTSVDAVNAIGAITETIAKISEISNAISAAVEEQSVTTTEMSSNMQAAAQGVQTIDNSMRGIAEALQSIDASTKNVREASAALA